MDIVGWIVWLGAAALSLAWSIVWFLVGGWVVTAAQIFVVVLAIFAYKFGWRRALGELMSRTSAVSRRAWAWVRRREVEPDRTATPQTGRTQVRIVRRSSVGDVNLSTLLSIIALAGIGFVLLI